MHIAKFFVQILQMVLYFVLCIDWPSSPVVSDHPLFTLFIACVCHVEFPEFHPVFPAGPPV